MCQVPPIGSFTSTLIGVALWLRRVISYSSSKTLGEMRWKSICLRSLVTSNALPICRLSASSFGVWVMRSSPMNWMPPFESDW